MILGTHCFQKLGLSHDAFFLWSYRNYYLFEKCLTLNKSWNKSAKKISNKKDSPHWKHILIVNIFSIHGFPHKNYLKSYGQMKVKKN